MSLMSSLGPEEVPPKYRTAASHCLSTSTIPRRHLWKRSVSVRLSYRDGRENAPSTLRTAWASFEKTASARVARLVLAKLYKNPSLPGDSRLFQLRPPRSRLTVHFAHRRQRVHQAAPLWKEHPP